MFKCSVCYYVHDGEEALEKCPKCGAPKEKFIAVENEVKEKILRSRFTNDLHFKLKNLLDEIIEISEAGIQDNLDPGCVKVFQMAKNSAFELGQMIKAEIEAHIKKEKWG